jgi:hypothetical protein
MKKTLALSIGTALGLPIMAPLLGGLVTTFILSLSFGYQSVLQFYVLSILCTVGVAAVLWFFLFFTVGTVTLFVLGAILSVFGVTIEKKKGKQDPDIIAITTYINQAHQAGFTKEKIIHNLTGAGWNEKKITASYHLLSKTSENTKKTA